MYHPPRGRNPRGNLTLMYHGGPPFWIEEAAAPDPQWEALEWESLERGGRRLSLSDTGTRKGMRVVALEHLGTYLTIYSGKEREELFELAAG